MPSAVLLTTAWCESCGLLPMALTAQITARSSLRADTWADAGTPQGAAPAPTSPGTAGAWIRPELRSGNATLQPQAVGTLRASPCPSMDWLRSCAARTRSYRRRAAHCTAARVMREMDRQQPAGTEALMPLGAPCSPGWQTLC